MWFSPLARSGYLGRLQFIGLLSTAVFVVPITVGKAQSVWWNALWKYRIPVTVQPNGYDRFDMPAEININFSDALANLGVSGSFDENSLRVVEVDPAGSVVNDTIPFQFDKDADFNEATKASGTLVVMATGKTPAGSQRSYHVYFDLTGSAFLPAAVATQISVTDDFDEGESSYKVSGRGVTYYYQKNAGGFSSILDGSGNDWVGYNPTPGSGSAGAFRGIPNAVYPEGTFHPGATNATSSLLSQGPLKVTIHTITNDSKWECTWEFFPRYARMTMLKVDHNYWLLYEGTPGGSLQENSDFVVRSDGTSTLAGVAWTGDITTNEWAYFTDPVVGRSLFLAHHEDDAQVDSYSSLDANMTVFGFGRSSLDNYLSTVPQHLTIGLFSSADFSHSADTIYSAYKDPSSSIGIPEHLSVQVPLLVSPPDSATKQPIPERLIWRAPQAVASYQVQVSVDPVFTDPLVLDDSLNTDTTIVLTQISQGTTYFWRVRSKNGSQVSNFSIPRSFTTLLPSPSLVYPQNHLLGVPLSPVFRWSKVQGAAGYRFELANDSTFVSGIAKDDSSLVDTFRAVNDLPGSTPYYWRVRARSAAGGSDFSPVWAFRTAGQLPSQVQLVSPAENAMSNPDSVRFVWYMAVPAIDRYWFELSGDSMFQFKVIDSTITDTSTVRIQLMPNHRYWWRVRGTNVDGWGPFSAVRTFEARVTGVDTAPGLPTKYDLLQNYPNPFNPSTAVSYTLPHGGGVVLEVFNLLGERVATLINAQEDAGYHTVTFTPEHLPSGVYLYRLSVNDQMLWKKMILMK